jgi:hypothetical protein
MTSDLRASAAARPSSLHTQTIGRRTIPDSATQPFCTFSAQSSYWHRQCAERGLQSDVMRQLPLRALWHTRLMARNAAGATIGALVAIGCALVVTPTPASASSSVPARVVAIVPGPVQPTSGHPPLFNRTDFVKIRFGAKPSKPVTCTVVLRYRGKVFGSGTVGNEPVSRRQLTIPASAYSRSRSTRGIESTLHCTISKTQGAESSQIPIFVITTEGP